jgi:hypothetical protein
MNALIPKTNTYLNYIQRYENPSIILINRSYNVSLGLVLMKVLTLISSILIDIVFGKEIKKMFVQSTKKLLFFEHTLIELCVREGSSV